MCFKKKQCLLIVLDISATIEKLKGNVWYCKNSKNGMGHNVYRKKERKFNLI